MGQEIVIQILLIDDDEEDYLITMDMLHAAHGLTFSLDWAATYRAGWEALQTNSYHTILIDYDLGQNNGIELIQAAIASGYREPLILLTGRGSHEVMTQAIKAGAADYLSKLEINPITLENSIRRAMGLQCSDSD